ncbi:MAG: endonuclease domain-containing protein [Spirochaetota bacterium]
MTKVFNRSSELEKRRALRTSATEAEKKIWTKLRTRNIKGCKFRRQYSIGPYIADFFCPQAKLAVEIDGNVHNSSDALEYDKARDEFIKSAGILVLRFTNSEVENNPENVVKEITKAIEDNITPSANPHCGTAKAEGTKPDAENGQ